jgi:hypothetical protein
LHPQTSKSVAISGIAGDRASVFLIFVIILELTLAIVLEIHKRDELGEEGLPIASMGPAQMSPMMGPSPPLDLEISH